MLELLITSITGLTLGIVGFRIKKISNPLTLENIFLLFYVFFSILGSYFLFLEVDERRVSRGALDQSILLQIWLYSIISIILVMLTAYTLKSIFQVDKKAKIINVKTINTQDPYSIQLLITIVLFSLTAIYMYILNPPLILLLTGGNIADAFIARQSVVVEQGVFKLKHLKFLTHQVQFFWLCYIYSCFLTDNNNKRSLIFFIALISLITAQVSNLSKGGTIYTFAALGIIYLFTRRKKLSFIKALFGVILILGLSILLQYLLLPSSGDFDAFKLIMAALSRMTTGQIEPSYYVIKYIHDFEYLFGVTFPNPKGILPFTHFDLETKTWELMNSYRLSQGLSYKNPTVFWADGYANFGILGVFFYSIIVGGVIFFVDFFIYRKRYLSNLDIGLMAYLCFHYARLSGKSLSTFIWDMDLIITLLFYLFCLRLFRVKNYK